MPDISFDDFRERLAGECSSGDFYQARQTAADFLARNASGRVLRFISGQVGQHRNTLRGIKPAKIAVLSSYSSEFLHDALIVACFLKGVVPEIYQPAFNQFRQDILASRSGLYRFSPDSVILSVLGENLCPALYDRIPSSETIHVEETVAEFEGLIDEFRGRSSAPLLVQSLLPPLYPVFGIGDANLPFGQRQQVQRINAAWERSAASGRGSMWSITRALSRVTGHSLGTTSGCDTSPSFRSTSACFCRSLASTRRSSTC
jgi:predicted enzyme involved in methoxymalonyl-ACP biosynthesis